MCNNTGMYWGNTLPPCCTHLVSCMAQGGILGIVCAGPRVGLHDPCGSLPIQDIPLFLTLQL